MLIEDMHACFYQQSLKKNKNIISKREQKNLPKVVNVETSTLHNAAIINCISVITIATIVQPLSPTDTLVRITISLIYDVTLNYIIFFIYISFLFTREQLGLDGTRMDLLLSLNEMS